MAASESEVIARKRALWQGATQVERFVEQMQEAYGPPRLKNRIETDIVRRFLCGEKLLDAGIGTGRVSLAFAQEGQRLTGLDASAAMIERCSRDPRSADVRLVHGQLEELPFDANDFDTVLSVDAFVHSPHWEANLDEILRVTRAGGRIIVDVGSLDHVNAVARCRGLSVDTVRATELDNPEAFLLRLATSDLLAYAASRHVSLIAIVPYGVVFGSLVVNYWFADSYAFRSGAIDRLVSWMGADPLLLAAAEFLERRVVQGLGASVSGRIFAVFEHRPNADVSRQTDVGGIAALDERGPMAWRSELEQHMKHRPSRAFAIALLLAAWPLRVPVSERAEMPPALRRDLERAEAAKERDDRCAQAVAAFTSDAEELAFHGVDLRAVFAPRLVRELRDRLEASE